MFGCGVVRCGRVLVDLVFFPFGVCELFAEHL